MLKRSLVLVVCFLLVACGDKAPPVKKAVIAKPALSSCTAKTRKTRVTGLNYTCADGKKFHLEILRCGSKKPYPIAAKITSGNLEVQFLESDQKDNYQDG